MELIAGEEQEEEEGGGEGEEDRAPLDDRRTVDMLALTDEKVPGFTSPPQNNSYCSLRPRS